MEAALPLPMTGEGFPAPRFAGLLGVFLGVVATIGDERSRARQFHRCPAESSFDETHPRAAGLSRAEGLERTVAC